MEYVVAILAVAAIVVFVLRSSGRGESAGNSFDREMRQLAAEAIHLAKNEYKLTLTNDRASIRDLEDKVIQDLRNNQLISPYAEDELAELSRLWGAYVGEVLRRIRPGKWRGSSRHGDRRPMPFVLNRNQEVFPCSWIYRRIKHGAEFGVHAKVCEFADNRDNPEYAVKGIESGGESTSA